MEVTEKGYIHSLSKTEINRNDNKYNFWIYSLHPNTSTHIKNMSVWSGLEVLKKKLCSLSVPPAV